MRRNELRDQLGGDGLAGRIRDLQDAIDAIEELALLGDDEALEDEGGAADEDVKVSIRVGDCYVVMPVEKAQFEVERERDELAKELSMA